MLGPVSAWVGDNRGRVKHHSAEPSTQTYSAWARPLWVGWYKYPVKAGGGSKSSGLVLGRRPLGAVLHSSNEPGELSQWLCHDDSTINIVMDIIIIFFKFYFFKEKNWIIIIIILL